MNQLKKVNKAFLENKFKILEKENPSKYESHSLSISEYGAPVLRNLTRKPAPYIIYIEDENSIFFDFWTLGEEVSYFDAKEGDFKIFYPRQQVIGRLYLDKAVMEIQLIDSSKENLDRVLEYLQILLRNDEIYFQEITMISEDQFRAIEPHLIKSHEKHEGNETSSALTRTSSTGDTRNDNQLHPIISKRRFSVLNGSSNRIPSVNYPVMISLNKSGQIMIKTRTVTPSERKDIINWVWGFIS